MVKIQGIPLAQQYGNTLQTINIGGLEVSFQRTCRVPEGQINDLPASLGQFPIYKVGDYKKSIPKTWHQDSFFMPMYPQEAMWISFGRGYHEQPKALIIGAGNINALSGKPFIPEESIDVKLDAEQNYLVVPPQPWIDGWKAKDGKVYQFVAAEMGSGETVEGQITGKEVAGGLQFIIYDPKPGKDLIPKSTPREHLVGGSPRYHDDGLFIGSMSLCSLSAEEPRHRGGIVESMMSSVSSMASLDSMDFAGESIEEIQSMGLGRGGEIEQQIHPDTHGFEVWNEKPTAVEMVYLVASKDFQQITGFSPPPTPVTFAEYQRQGLPWFALWDQKLGDTAGSDVFATLNPVQSGKIGGEPDILDKLKPVTRQYKGQQKE